MECGESTGIRGCTCFLGGPLHSSSNCSTSWAPWSSSLFTQQTVEEVSQHSLIGSPRCRRNIKLKITSVLQKPPFLVKIVKDNKITNRNF